MTNFEKYKELLIEISTELDTGVAVCKGIPCSCGSVSCDDCKFFQPRKSCSAMFIRWLYEEYEEKPKISERFYHFLKSLPNGARIKYSGGILYINVGDGIESIYFDDNLFIPKLPALLENIWYEVSELLELEVQE